MPADATYLACNYFFTSNSTITSNTQENTNSTKTGNINKTTPTSSGQHKETNNNMELYKAKPQYLNIYSPVNTGVSSKNNLTGLTSSIQCATSSLASSLNNSANNIAQEPSKNALLLDLQWSKIKKIGTGLFNLGNNCYLNATLQCMAYTPSLSQWLVSRPHTPICKLKPLKGFCSLCEVEKIIYDIFNSCNGCAKPNSLCFNIKKVSNVFGVGTQEDASEFFTTLLESMAKSMKFTLNPSQSTSKLSFNVLDEIFSFQFRSRITCCNCGRLSDTFENTNSWPVDVKYVTDIRKGMLHFLREEVLDGENSYKCDKCNRKVRATKKYSIQTAPNVLVINLKRFDFTYAGKLTHFVTYPETLSLKTFITESEINTLTSQATDTQDSSSSIRNVTYKLYGVLVHLGYTSHSGHYYSYVRGPNDVWYKADDQTISTVRLQDAMDQNAYILFYNRIPQQQQQQQINKETFLLPQPMSTFGPFLQKPSYPTRPVQVATNKETVKEHFEDVRKENSDSPQLNINIPENKFKSTFVAVKSLSDDEDSGTESKEVKENDRSNSNRTLDYDQVLKLKRIQKRKLKLYNRKKKLKELKAHKKLMKADISSSTEEDYNKNKLALKRLKKCIKELKKLIKKEKSQLRRLKRCESCSSGPSSSDEEISEFEGYNCSLKRKSPSSDTDNAVSKVREEAERTNKFKKSKTASIATESNSLNLLKQYSSSVSSSDDDDEDNESTSSRQDRSRSSSSGSNSSGSSSNRSKNEQSRSSKVEEREEGELVEGEVDSSHNNLVSKSSEKLSRSSSREEAKPRPESGSSMSEFNSSSSSSQNQNNEGKYKSLNSDYSSSYSKKSYYNNTGTTNFWKNHRYSNPNHTYRYNKNNKNYSYYRHKSSTWYNHQRY